MELMLFFLNREQVKEIIPMADFSENVRFPIFGGLMQPSAGTARHDAVAWGYARQADSMGVDIIQNCEVTGFDVSVSEKIKGVRTSRGDIKGKKNWIVCCRQYKHFSRKTKYEITN